MFIHQSESTMYYSSLSFDTKLKTTSSYYLVKTDIDDIRPKVTHPDLTSLTRVIPLQTPNFPSTINDSTILLKWGDICILLVSQFLLWFSRLKKHRRNLKSRFFFRIENIQYGTKVSQCFFMGDFFYLSFLYCSIVKSVSLNYKSNAQQCLPNFKSRIFIFFALTLKLNYLINFQWFQFHVVHVYCPIYCVYDVKNLKKCKLWIKFLY